jgi:uncharacterized protein (DUF1697 family)
MARHVALLRAINVGGRNKVPMKDLRALFEAAGCADVQTYIQSGNVVYSADTALAGAVPERLSAAIERAFGLQVPITTRTAAELRTVAEGNPFLPGVDPKWLHVVFLADRPAPERVAALDPNRSPPDEWLVRGREIYLHLPHGMGKSKITSAWLDSRLATMSTARNWRTVLTLLEMCGG